MKLSRKDWNNYVTRLSAINKTAGKKMQAYIAKHGTEDVNALVEYAYALTTRYGEAASATACQMYDEIAAIQKAHVPPAEPKATQHINYVDKAIRSTLERAPSLVPSTVGEMVKRTGAETTLKNAKRDGAYFAWVPNGDTCAFCITLASNGWRRASRKTINGDHAEHIHKNCDCEFAISFNRPGEIEGYDPDKYLSMYEGAEGTSWKDKVNALRRAQYAADPEKIRAQKRAAYARKVATVKGLAAAGKKETWIGELAPDERDKYGQIIRRGTDKMQRGFSCFGDSPLDQILRLGASRIEPKEGFFDVAMHGKETAVCFGGREPNMSPRLLADIIKHHPDYHGENIRLFCCKTGKTNGIPDWEYCFAEELANNLGVIVEAPDDLMYIRSNGTWYVGTPNNKKLIPFKPNQRGRYK